jgi:hypothetical protein
MPPMNGTLGMFMALAGLPGKPIGRCPRPPWPPHGPLLEWHLHDGHLKKVYSLNSHQEGLGPP